MTERCPASVTSAQPEGAGRAQEVRNDRPHHRSDGTKAVQRPAHGASGIAHRRIIKLLAAIIKRAAGDWYIFMGHRVGGSAAFEQTPG